MLKVREGQGDENGRDEYADVFLIAKWYKPLEVVFADDVGISVLGVMEAELISVLGVIEAELGVIDIEVTPTKPMIKTLAFKVKGLQTLLGIR